MTVNYLVDAFIIHNDVQMSTIVYEVVINLSAGHDFTKGKCPAIMGNMKDLILTAGEVAKLKGVTRSAVYAAIAQKRLPHVRVLGRLGIRRSAAQTWHPTRWAGRPRGIPMSAESKQRISTTQKRRWNHRKRTIRQTYP